MNILYRRPLPHTNTQPETLHLRLLNIDIVLVVLASGYNLAILLSLHYASKETESFASVYDLCRRSQHTMSTMH